MTNSLVKTFNHRLSESCAKVIKNSRIKQPHAFEYLENIYGVVDSAHQLINEFALTHMLMDDLMSNNWTIAKPIISTNSSSPNRNYGILQKGQDILEIIVGDTYYGDVLSTYIVTDHNNFDTSGRKVLCLSPEIYGFYETSVDPNIKNTAPNKLFNCFISAASNYRQLCFYELVRHNIIHFGHVSYLVADSSSVTKNTVEQQKARYDQYKKEPLFDIFDYEHQMMFDSIPFKNFNMSLDQAIVDSKISLVIETTDNTPNSFFFTEKTFRALLSPRPFLLLLPGYKSNAITYLKNIGFDVYDDIIDHSYDQIRDPVERMIVAFKEIIKLQDFEYSPSMLLDFESRAAHNMALVKRFRQEIPQKYQTVVDALTWI